MPDEADATRHPALTDPQTGLANRLHFELVYRYLFGAGDRGVALTLMLFHVEGFDDTLAAERARAVAELFEQNTRANDLIAHLDDERFALLLLGANVPGGLLAADRLETALSGVAPGAVSMGLAGFSPDMQASSELVDAAAGALAIARAGGGGVEVAAP